MECRVKIDGCYVEFTYVSHRGRPDFSEFGLNKITCNFLQNPVQLIQQGPVNRMIPTTPRRPGPDLVLRRHRGGRFLPLPLETAFEQIC